MNKKNIFLVIILFLVLSITVGFSAFASEMSIGKIVADVRVKKDVRITNVTAATEAVDNANPNTLNYDVDSVLINTMFDATNSHSNYNVTITNFGNVNMGIYDISVSEGFNYVVNSDELGTSLCNDSGKCTLGANKTIYLKIYPNSSDYYGEQEIKVDFDFRKMHTVNYEGITNNGDYPTEVIDGGNLNFTFSGTIPNPFFVFVNDLKLDSSKYNYTNGQLVFNNVTGNVTLMSTKEIYKIMSLTTNGSDSKIDLSVASSETNGLGINTYNASMNDEYPIYYYRGAVTDNHVKFANFCWRIVRTTDTGGVKLIYNGVPADDGSCNNTGDNSRLQYNSNFASTDNSPAYAGWMQGTIYTTSSKDLTDQAESYIYGNDVSWNGSKYTLKTTMSSSSWTNDRTTLATKYHYTCFNSTGTCTSVYYVMHYANETTAYFLTFSNGVNLDDAKEAMYTNTNDSLMKKYVDEWYTENMTSYTNKLEDTIFCNDRTTASGALHSKDYDAKTYHSYYLNYANNVSGVSPSLTCPNVRDSFTMNTSNGNGKLIYPVGLLTADEFTLAGSGNQGYDSTAYLNIGKNQWTMTPYRYSANTANNYYLDTDGYLHSTPASYNRAVRPVVSLKSGTVYKSGTGTATSPYIVE